MQYVSIIFKHLKTGTAQTSAKIIDIGRGLEFMISYCECQSTTNEKANELNRDNFNINILPTLKLIYPPPRLGWDSKNQKCCETTQRTSSADFLKFNTRSAYRVQVLSSNQQTLFFLNAWIVVNLLGITVN